MSGFYPPPPSNPVINYGHHDAQRRTSGLAIASLVLGILGCIPFITGLLAIIFGIIGIKRTRDPYVNGKGLAIAGLVLGIISMLGWTGFGGLLGYGYLESKPAGIVAKSFLQNVCSGNINAAVSSSGFTASQLQTQRGQMAQFGTLQSVTLSSFNVSTLNGRTTMRLGGTAIFTNGSKTCTFELVKNGGTYIVTGYWVQ